MQFHSKNIYLVVACWSAIYLAANCIPASTLEPAVVRPENPLSSSSIGCYTCATENLRDSWYLTGYPVEVTPESFTDDCKDSGLVQDMDDVACDGTCVTYKFSIPIGDGIKYTNAYVRGCLNLLTGMSTNRIAKDYCEHEQHITSKAYHRQARFCRTDRCNAQKDDDEEHGASDYGRHCQTASGLGAKKDIDCYSCENSKTCSNSVTADKGNWCFKLYRKNGTARTYERAVTKVNQLGTPGCYEYNSPAMSAPHVVESMCFCDKELCNAGQRPTLVGNAAGMVVVVIAAMVVAWINNAL